MQSDDGCQQLHLTKWRTGRLKASWRSRPKIEVLIPPKIVVRYYRAPILAEKKEPPRGQLF